MLDLPGIDVNAMDSEGQTALYYAATYNYKEFVAVLLDQAVDVNAVVDRRGHIKKLNHKTFLLQRSCWRASMTPTAHSPRCWAPGTLS